MRCSRASAGSGRWASDKVWLYDFRDALPPGTRCSVKVRSDWKPASADPARPASALTGVTEFAFNTGGPAVVSSTPYDGAQVEEDQYFLLRLSGPAVESSVLANARCEVDGIGERIGVRVIAGNERDELLKGTGILPQILSDPGADMPAVSRSRSPGLIRAGRTPRFPRQLPPPTQSRPHRPSPGAFVGRFLPAR